MGVLHQTQHALLPAARREACQTWQNYTPALFRDGSKLSRSCVHSQDHYYRFSKTEFEFDINLLKSIWDGSKISRYCVTFTGTDFFQNRIWIWHWTFKEHLICVADLIGMFINRRISIDYWTFKRRFERGKIYINLFSKFELAKSTFYDRIGIILLLFYIG